MQTNILKFICLLSVLLVAISGCTPKPESELIGQKAPDFTLDSLDGGKVSLISLSGKPILLEVWAPWCPTCLHNIAPTKELYSRFADKVHIIAPALEENRNEINAFVRNHDITYPIVIATRNFATDYKISTIPATIIIDANGIVRYKHMGRMRLEEISVILKSLL